jgi:hypothetical protein
MKVRVKKGMMGYFGDRRWREGQVLDLPPSACKKVPKDYDAAKHGPKMGDALLPKWVEPIDAPVQPDKGIPGTKRVVPGAGHQANNQEVL